MTARDEKALRHIDCLWTWLVTVHHGDVLVYLQRRSLIWDRVLSALRAQPASKEQT